MSAAAGDAIVHVVPGWGAAAAVAEAHPEASVVRCTEDVSLGPCRFGEPVDTLQFLLRRASWLAVHWDLPEIAEDMAADAEALAAGLAGMAARGGVLWTSDVAHQQLGLCWQLATILARGKDLPHVYVARGPIGRRSRSVALLRPEEVAAVVPRVLGATEVERAVDLWNAWTAPTPERFADLAYALTGDALLGSVSCLRGRFPSAQDGLTVSERQLLRRIEENEGEPTSLTIAHVMVEGFDVVPDMVGDLFLFARLRELAWQGLLDQTGGGTMSKTAFTLTDLGRRVLRAEVHRLDVAPLDRWIGGTHLTEGSPVWVLDGDELRQR